MNREIIIASVTAFTLVRFLSDATADAASVEAVIEKSIFHVSIALPHDQRRVVVSCDHPPILSALHKQGT
ncbi:hypothetical protein [Mesorhizobium onobrychidis]|uniref:Uncharacterized protein n=1 Tax=Mesorhizobium onobrychidis TaxID=2775404 RepID=A0ABY5R2G7_9HYPH|nr:hypothetical protein [Mesorhizobium onobrychidis]UVC17633.1 hypothetical protein IHQ72_11365 [Mesorhizobium onobrychidis]